MINMCIPLFVFYTQPDAVADITMARQGFPRMAIGACFGGPLLSILSNVALNFKRLHAVCIVANVPITRSDNFLVLSLISLTFSMKTCCWALD